MKCPKCGSEVQESKFCSECEAPLSEETAAQEKAQANSKKKPKKKRGCGTVFLVFFAFILISEKKTGIMACFGNSTTPDLIGYSSQM